MITFILISVCGLLAIGLVLLAWSKGARASNGKSGTENRSTPQDPKVGRAAGMD